MIENLHPQEELIGFARKQAKDDIEETVKPSQLEELLADGWRLKKKNKKSVRLAKPKKKSVLLESRVWALFYRMGFSHMSGKGGAFLTVSATHDNGPKDQLDVVGVDEEVAICVQCKTSERPSKDASFPTWSAKHASLKRNFADSVKRAVPTSTKRQTAMVVFTWGLILKENDRKRAEDLGLALYDEQDLLYFEALVKHLGPAAKYQFLAEVCAGRQIAGLEIKVPALRTKMGKAVCYTFALKPEYLLKIAYVAHRAKGKAIEVDKYQRMVKKSRLKDIRQYISEGNVFPTNIVINIQRSKYVQFDRGQQDGDASSATFGWLKLSPSYGSAWIIDGQHRLFAFSGHERGRKDYLNVLAFQSLPASAQAQMFVDINHEQKSVSRILLVELAADLKWDAEDEEERIQAVISKVGMALDEDNDSPLQNRILLADVKRTATRCVSLTTLFSALSKGGLFVVARRKGVTEYGPLWVGDPSASLKRTVAVVKGWLGGIAEAASDWWELGAAEGGGLAMNNGVTVCLNMLRSVLDHIGKPADLRMLDAEDLVEWLSSYATAIGDYFARMTPEERQSFRSLQGSAGQLIGTRMCQEALRQEDTQYSPEGLAEWIEEREANNNAAAKPIVDWIENCLHDYVIATLKDNYSSDDNEWWYQGVPKLIRSKVDQRINDSDGKAGTREQNFDLIHYREIIQKNWQLFEGLLAYGAKGSKEKRTGWIFEIGQMRNRIAHTTRKQFLSSEDLSKLRMYKEWLEEKMTQLPESG